MKKYILTGLILMSFLFVLSGCGGNDGIDLGPGGCVTAPVGSILNIQPGDFSKTDPDPASVHTTNFTISVTDENGIPLNDVLLWISYPFAVPDSSGRVQLYDGDVSKPSPMNVCTDVDGLYHLRFDYISGLVGEDPITYTGALKAESGQAIDTVTVSIN